MAPGPPHVQSPFETAARDQRLSTISCITAIRPAHSRADGSPPADLVVAETSASVISSGGVRRQREGPLRGKKSARDQRRREPQHVLPAPLPSRGDLFGEFRSVVELQWAAERTESPDAKVREGMLEVADPAPQRTQGNPAAATGIGEPTWRRAHTRQPRRPNESRRRTTRPAKRTGSAPRACGEAARPSARAASLIPKVAPSARRPRCAGVRPADLLRIADRSSSPARASCYARGQARTAGPSPRHRPRRRRG